MQVYSRIKKALKSLVNTVLSVASCQLSQKFRTVRDLLTVSNWSASRAEFQHLEHLSAQSPIVRAVKNSWPRCLTGEALRLSAPNPKVINPYTGIPTNRGPQQKPQDTEVNVKS